MQAITCLVSSVVVLATCACSSTGSVADAGASKDAAPLVDSGTTDGGGGDGGVTLQWYETCGDPVCQSPIDAGATTIDAGPPCPAIGTSCTTKGETCGARNPQVDCGANEVCDDHDPKSLGCPISSRKFKDDVRYLDEPALERLHAETMAMRLATYEYKPQYGDPTEKHLGFIIEDQPASMSVDRGHDRVDMYGYLSMVVATMQVQEKEIARLRHELETTRACRSK